MTRAEFFNYGCGFLPLLHVVMVPEAFQKKLEPMSRITVEMSSAKLHKSSHHSSLIHAHAEIDGVHMHKYDFIHGNVAAEVKR